MVTAQRVSYTCRRGSIEFLASQMFASVPTKETPVLKSSRVTNQENTHTKTKQSEISTKSSVQIGIYLTLRNHCGDAIERGARQHTNDFFKRFLRLYHWN